MISGKILSSRSKKLCIISRNEQLLSMMKPIEIKDTYYEKTNEEYTNNVQEQIELGGNSKVTNVRRDTGFRILKQQYQLEMGTELENHQQSYPDVHLNSAALSQQHQSAVRAPTILIMDSKLFFSKITGYNPISQS